MVPRSRPQLTVPSNVDSVVSKNTYFSINHFNDDSAFMIIIFTLTAKEVNCARYASSCLTVRLVWIDLIGDSTVFVHQASKAQRVNTVSSNCPPNYKFSSCILDDFSKYSELEQFNMTADRANSVTQIYTNPKTFLLTKT